MTETIKIILIEDRDEELRGWENTKPLTLEERKALFDAGKSFRIDQPSNESETKEE